MHAWTLLQPLCMGKTSASMHGQLSSQLEVASWLFNARMLEALETCWKVADHGLPSVAVSEWTRGSQ